MIEGAKHLFRTSSKKSCITMLSIASIAKKLRLRKATSRPRRRDCSRCSVVTFRAASKSKAKAETHGGVSRHSRWRWFRAAAAPLLMTLMGKSLMALPISPPVSLERRDAHRCLNLPLSTLMGGRDCDLQSDRVSS